MGDRGNIIVRQEAGTNTDDVWFYTFSVRFPKGNARTIIRT